MNRDQTPEGIEAPYIHVTFEDDGDSSLLAYFHLNENDGTNVNHWSLVMGMLETALQSVDWSYEVVKAD